MDWGTPIDGTQGGGALAALALVYVDFSMRRVMGASAFLPVVIAVLSSCGATVEGGAGGSGGSAGSNNNGCTGGEVSLTVKNIETWCSFEINGANESSAASETVCVAPGTVKLSAKPHPGFELGPAPWHDINQLNGGTATVILPAGTSTKCVWVCCPGEGAGGAPCPESDQCLL